MIANPKNISLSQTFGLTKRISVDIMLPLLLLPSLQNQYRGIDVYNHNADE